MILAIGRWKRGGATFDSCIRFLGEDPWVRLRELKKLVQKLHYKCYYVAKTY